MDKKIYKCKYCGKVVDNILNLSLCESACYKNRISQKAKENKNNSEHSNSYWR